jgi:hypothetical protein
MLQGNTVGLQQWQSRRCITRELYATEPSTMRRRDLRRGHVRSFLQVRHPRLPFNYEIERHTV